MTIIDHNNIVIKRSGTGANKAVIVSHGGYTPRRDIIRQGSGTVAVPPGVTLHFDALWDSFAIGSHAMHLLQGFDVAPLDTAGPGDVVPNYSLTHDDKFDCLLPNEAWDVILISPRGKAHLSDVFDAIRVHNLGYTELRSFFCRVNKLTFEFSVSRVPSEA